MSGRVGGGGKREPDGREDRVGFRSSWWGGREGGRSSGLPPLPPPLPVHTHTQAQTRTHTHTDAHTDTHTHTHTHTDTHTGPACLSLCLFPPPPSATQGQSHKAEEEGGGGTAAEGQGACVCMRAIKAAPQGRGGRRRRHSSTPVLCNSPQGVGLLERVRKRSGAAWGQGSRRQGGGAGVEKASECRLWRVGRLPHAALTTKVR